MNDNQMFSISSEAFGPKIHKDILPGTPMDNISDISKSFDSTASMTDQRANLHDDHLHSLNTIQLNHQSQSLNRTHLLNHVVSKFAELDQSHMQPHNGRANIFNSIFLLDKI